MLVGQVNAYLWSWCMPDQPIKNGHVGLQAWCRHTISWMGNSTVSSQWSFCLTGPCIYKLCRESNSMRKMITCQPWPVRDVGLSHIHQNVLKLRNMLLTRLHHITPKMPAQYIYICGNWCLISQVSIPSRCQTSPLLHLELVYVELKW